MRYHVKTGITGYGPDLDESDEPYDGVDAVCMAINDELVAHIDMLAEDADQLGGGGFYEDAWKTAKLADYLDNVRRNFDPSRANAPLFRGNPKLWHETVSRLIGETFPLDVDLGETRRVYVWEADDDA